MALIPNPTLGVITKTDDGSTTTVTDATNYGAPEVERNTKAVYLLAFKVDEDLVEVGLDVETNDPLTVEDFTVENTTDGHQKFVLLIVQIYQGGEQYEDNDVVYYDGVLYQNVSGGNLTGSTPAVGVNWAVVTADDIYELIGTADEPANLLYEVLQHVLAFTAEQCLGEIAPAHAKANCCGECTNPALETKFRELWLLIYVANIASNRGRYTEGERYMRSAENYCDCGC
jgi:hypothetical protein